MRAVEQRMINRLLTEFRGSLGTEDTLMKIKMRAEELVERDIQDGREWQCARCGMSMGLFAHLKVEVMLLENHLAVTCICGEC